MSDTYPSISQSASIEILAKYRNGEASSRNVKDATEGRFANQEDEIKISSGIYRLAELVDELDLNGSSKAQQFGRIGSKILHEEFDLLLAPSRDPGFWRWVTLNEYIGACIVDKRYGINSEPGSARDIYYGIGPVKDSFLGSLWLRADICFDTTLQQDQYKLLELNSDNDFWYSHILDVEIGSCRSLARAFIKFVYDKKIQRGKVNDPSVPVGYRDLAPELTRRLATLSLELLDDEKAYSFINEVWAQRKFWSSKS